MSDGIKRRGLTKTAREQITKPGLDKFSFMGNYRAVADENPLVSGQMSEEAREMYNDGVEEEKQELLDLNLVDLIEAGKVFPEEGLSMKEFVVAFTKLCGEEHAQQLSYLFMKIDCNSDGTLVWDEFLTYIMARGNSRVAPLADERMHKELVRQMPPECARGAMHREPATQLLFAQNCGAYVSAARDGTLRVWNAQMMHERTIEVSDKLLGIQDMAVVPKLHKLVVATDDRQLMLFEMLDYANAQRWALYGKLTMKELPVSLASWAHPEKADNNLLTICLAVGTEEGHILILDARKLISQIKGRGNEPALEAAIRASKDIESARIVQLSKHSDWVSKLEYHADMRALVSGGYDSMLRVTHLNWAPSSVPSHVKPGSKRVEVEHAEFRSLFALRAHSKGVHSFVLMTLLGKSKGMTLCATCGFERHVFVWNLETSDLVRTLDGHRSTVWCLTWDPAAQLLFTLSVDGELRTWDLTDLNVVNNLNQVLMSCMS